MGALAGGSFDACSGSSSYDAGLTMNGGSNGMDMSFLSMGVSSDDPMKTQLPKGMNDDLSYINDDGGYAASLAAGMEQQQDEEVVVDQHQDEINNTNNTDGAEG